VLHLGLGGALARVVVLTRVGRARTLEPQRQRSLARPWGRGSHPFGRARGQGDDRRPVRREERVRRAGFPRFAPSPARMQSWLSCVPPAHFICRRPIQHTSLSCVTGRPGVFATRGTQLQTFAIRGILVSSAVICHLLSSAVISQRATTCDPGAAGRGERHSKSLLTEEARELYEQLALSILLTFPQRAAR
jgi:hypothetical protein